MKKIISLLFIPQDGNNQRARILHPLFLTLLIVVYLLNQSLIKTLTVIKPGVLGYASEITAQKILDLTNLERQKAGIPALQFNSILSQSAAKKAQDMFDNNYWAHNSPIGKTPWDFLREENYQYISAGENLAKDFYDSDSVVRAWMRSPTHRDNIVNEKFQEIGVGVVNGVLDGIKTTLVVQHFGTPRGGVVMSQVTDKISSEPQPVVQQNPSISPLMLSKIFGVFMFILIVVSLIIDGVVTVKNQNHRLTGSTAGHVGFLLIIFILMIFSRQGAIF